MSTARSWGSERTAAQKQASTRASLRKPLCHCVGTIRRSQTQSVRRNPTQSHCLDGVILPFDPTEKYIDVEDIDHMISYFEEKEEYEKCAFLKNFKSNINLDKY